VVTVKGRFEKDDVKEQYADYTPTINTKVNINKNKIPDMFAKKDRFEKTDVTTLDTESVLAINNPANIVTRKVKNKPWSALYGSATLGYKLPLSAHKYLPNPATIPSTR
jgi:hypothetical protein